MAKAYEITEEMSNEIRMIRKTIKKSRIEIRLIFLYNIFMTTE